MSLPVATPLPAAAPGPQLVGHHASARRRNSERELRRRYVGLALLACGVVVVSSDLIAGRLLLVASGTLGAGLALATIRHPAGWLSPFGLPLLYITAVHTIPLLMAERWFFEGREVTLINGLVGRDMADDATTTALGLLILGFIAGVSLIWNGVLTPQQLKATLDQPIAPEVRARLRRVGLIALWSAAAMQALYVARNGFSRFAPTGFDKELTTTSRILTMAGVACIVIGAGQRSRLVSSRNIETWLMLVVLGLAVAWGSRAALLAPGLLLAFVLTVRQPNRQSGLRLLGGLGLLGFVVVAETRIRGAGNLSGFDVETVLERSIKDINAPTYLTYYTSQNLSGEELSFGSTYVAAIPHMLPSILVDRVGLALPQLATERYRDLIDFSSQRRGFGFGVVAEAVMNFGSAGALLAGVVLGLVAGLFYRLMLTGSNTTVVRRWVYPLLFASIPWIIRSDVLQGLKPLVYSVAAIALATFAVKEANDRVRVVGSRA